MTKTSYQRRTTTWLTYGWLALLLLFAWFLRLQGLSERTFWQDEGLTLWQIRQPLRVVWAGIIEVQGVPTQNTHPPFYFLLLWAVRHAIGMSPFAVRLFSVWWSVLTIPLLYVGTARLAGRRAGLVSATLVAFSPLYLWYAQEVRMYAMLVALAALSLYTLVRFVEHPTRRTAALYLLSAAALAWTHYAALFFLGAQFVFLFFTLGRRHMRLYMLAAVVAAGVVAPFVPFIIKRLGVVERDFFFVPLRVMARDLLHGFTVGISLPITYSTPIEAIAVLACLGGAWVLGARTRQWFPRRNRWLAALTWAGLVVLPVLGMYLASYIKPMYQGVRHLMVISPAFYLLAGVGLAALAARHRVGMGAAAALLTCWLLALGVSTVAYFTDPTYQKDDTRGMFAYIADYFRPGDLVVLHDPVLSHVLEYEQPTLPWTALPRYGTHVDMPVARRHFSETLQSAERIWYVYSPSNSLADPDNKVDTWFAQAADVLDARLFHGQTVTLGVTYYDPQGAIAETPHPTNVPLGVVYASEGIRLEGARVPARDVRAGERFFFDLVWFNERPIQRDIKVSVRLFAPDGTLWAQEDQFPFAGLAPTTTWSPGVYRRSPHSVRVPVGTPPATYEVRILLYDAATGEPLNHEGGAADVSLGQVRVLASTHPGAWHPPVRLNAETGAIRLLGAEPWRSAVRVGQELPLSFYLMVPPEYADAFFDVEVLADNGARLAHAEAPLLPAYVAPAALSGPTIIQVRRTLDISPVGPAGTATVRVRLRTAQGEPLAWQRWWGLRQQEWLDVGQIVVEDRPRRFDLPEIGKAMNVAWAQGVRLARADWPAEVARGEMLPVVLVWQAGGATEARFKVFVHMRDADNRVVAQHDAEPANGTAPTNGWQPGESIVDEHEITVPLDLPVGTYTLYVGLYDEATGARLPLADGGDEWRLGIVRVYAP